MSTAPQDGTPVLVYRDDAGVFMAHFVAAAVFVKDGDDTPQWWTIEGQDLATEMPSHWMPMPTPPAKET